MSDQPEALRLADLLQDECGVDGYVHDEAAALLRRQHAEIEKLWVELDEDMGVINDWRTRTERAEDERDALLEALTEIVSAADGDGWKQLDATFASARAAIAKTTGGNDE